MVVNLKIALGDFLFKKSFMAYQSFVEVLKIYYEELQKLSCKLYQTFKLACVVPGL